MTPPRTLADLDWDSWRPTDVATLVFIVRGAELLLIRKKRGLGAGKINGPGGRLEPGEALEACAVREVQEELCVTPHAPHWCGENRFAFADGYGIHVHVYHSDGFSGEPTETAEASPLWVPASAIPYGEMWADDVLWLPLALARRRFAGRYLFDGDRLLDHALEIEPDAPRGGR